MANHMVLSERGFALIKGFEGLRLAAYQDAVGKWTIGYGHTGLPEVHAGDVLTQEEADALLSFDAGKAADCVNTSVTVPLTQNQFDALVDFVFNLGCASLQTSTLLRKLNEGDYAGAAGEFTRWIYAGRVVLPGLVTRRNREMKLFLEADK